MPGCYSVEIQKIFDFIGCQTPFDILLIAKNEQCRPHKFLLLQQAMQLYFCVFQPQLVTAIDHPYDSVCLFKIISPIRSNGLLPADVPYIQFVVIVFQRLNIETKCWRYFIDVLTIELLNNGGLAGIIQPQYQESHFLLLLLGLLDDGHEPHYSSDLYIQIQLIEVIQAYKEYFLAAYQIDMISSKIMNIFRYCPVYLFSSQQPIQSTFKIRSKLSEFFKHTHPDILHNAPEKIKQQNLRSLKNLNSYIDCVSQNKTIEAKLLKFYVAEKSNNKSKKYYSFQVQLPDINPNTLKSIEDSNRLMNNISDILNKKFLETRIEHNPKLKKELAKEKEQQETPQNEFDNIQMELKPFKKQKASHRQEFRERFNKKIQEAYMKSEKEQLVTEMQKKVLFANTPTNKPMLWSRIALKQAGLFKDFQEELENLIDPRLIYFDEALIIDEIDRFKTNLVGSVGQDRLANYLQREKLYEVFLEMQKQQPPIMLYVTKQYSARQIPGFFSIPYNFKIKQLVEFFKNNRAVIIEEKLKYEQLYEISRELMADLEKKNNIKIRFDSHKNIEQITKKILFLKRLSHYKMSELVSFVSFDTEQYNIFCQQYKLNPAVTCHQYNSKVIIKIEFYDSDLAAMAS